MPISDAGWGAAEIHRTYISNKIISHGWLSRVLVPRAGSILSESVPCGKPPQRRGNAHAACRCKTKTRSARRRGGGAEDDDEEQDPTELSWQHPYFTLYIAHTLTAFAIPCAIHTQASLSLLVSESTCTPAGTAARLMATAHDSHDSRLRSLGWALGSGILGPLSASGLAWVRSGSRFISRFFCTRNR